MQDEGNGSAAALGADQDERGSPEPETKAGERLTVTVPEAACLLGISRTAGYEAAHRGELPVLRIGRRMVVPRAALRRLLDGAHVRPREQQ